MRMERLTKGVYQLGAGMVNSYIIDGDEGVTLVDTLIRGRESAIDQNLKEIGRTLTDVRRDPAHPLPHGPRGKRCGGQGGLQGQALRIRSRHTCDSGNREATHTAYPLVLPADVLVGGLLPKRTSRRGRPLRLRRWQRSASRRSSCDRHARTHSWTHLIPPGSSRRSPPRGGRRYRHQGRQGETRLLQPVHTSSRRQSAPSRRIRVRDRSLLPLQTDPRSGLRSLPTIRRVPHHTETPGQHITVPPAPAARFGGDHGSWCGREPDAGSKTVGPHLEECRQRRVGSGAFG